MNTLAQQLEMYLDDSLTAEDAEALLARLRDNPEDLAEARASLDINGLLVEQLTDNDSEELAELVMRSIDIGQVPGSFEEGVIAQLSARPRRRPHGLFLALAAAALCLVAGLLWHSPPPGLPPEPVEQVVVPANHPANEYFVLDLRGDAQELTQLVLHNGGESGYFSKRFSLAVSATDEDDFRTVLEGELPPKVGPQIFALDGVVASFAKLTIHSGYQPGFVQLSEWELRTPQGRNVAAGARLFDFRSDYPHRRGYDFWAASNIIDGSAQGGPSDSWSSNGQPLVDEFITIRLAGEDAQSLQSLRIVNYGQEEEGYAYYSKDFSIEISATGADDAAFQPVLEGSLDASVEGQNFVLGGIARYLRLRIRSGYRAGFVELGEIEVYNADGVNVAAAAQGARVAAFSSQDPRHLRAGIWAVKNVIDGEPGGHRGSWASAMIPPSLLPTLARAE